MVISLMTEKEKMLAGEVYDAATDSVLIGERAVCKELCRDYNDLRPGDMDKRTAMLHRILGEIAGDLFVEQPFHCDYGYNIKVGKNFYANFNLVVLDEAIVSFGDNVFIGPNCGFYTACHPLDAQERNRGVEFARPISIGNNVWIGAQACILPGVSIGDNCVIGAGSVVCSDIPANSLAVGNPSRVIRKIN